MPRKPTSQAVFRSARINPVHPQEKTALEYIQKWEARGLSFKQIIVDACNRCDGATPEMFAPEQSQMEQSIQGMLSDFIAELTQRFNSGQLRIATSVDEDARQPDGLSVFAKNFSKGLLQRQTMMQGDEDNGEE